MEETTYTTQDSDNENNSEVNNSSGYRESIEALIRDYANHPGTEGELAQLIETVDVFLFVEDIFPSHPEDLVPAKLIYYWNVLSYKSSDEPDWLDAYVRLCVLLGKLSELEEVYNDVPEKERGNLFSCFTGQINELMAINQMCVDFIVRESVKIDGILVLDKFLRGNSWNKRFLDIFDEEGVTKEQIMIHYLKKNLFVVNKVLIDTLLSDDVDIVSCLRGLKEVKYDRRNFMRHYDDSFDF